MPLKDKISRLSTSARWRADKQIRLLQKQNEIHVIENQINSKKSHLAETSLKLFDKKNLQDQELIDLCLQIFELQNKSQELYELLEAIRNEENPSFPIDFTVYSENSTSEFSGLICPNCHRKLTRSHCPEHGIKGVQVETNDEENESVVLNRD